MQTFHDHKLWQDAYVAVMDVYEAINNDSSEVLLEIRRHALSILSVIADALSRVDKHERISKFHDAIGEVASIRSLLSVAWGQQVLSDEIFRAIDRSYESLGKELSSIH